MSVIELQVRQNPRPKPDSFYLAPDLTGWSVTICAGARFHSRTIHRDEAAVRAAAEILVREGFMQIQRAPWVDHSNEGA